MNHITTKANENKKTPNVLFILVIIQFICILSPSMELTKRQDHGRYMQTHRFEVGISHHQAKQPSQFPVQELVDYFGIAYDIIRNELNELGCNGAILLKHRPSDGILDIAIKGRADDAEKAVNALHRLGLTSPLKIAA